MNTKLASMVVNYVAANAELNDRLLAEVHTTRKSASSARNKQAAVLQLMLDTGAAPATEKLAAQTMLANHEQCLDLLTNAISKCHQLKQAADQTTEKAASTLGQPAPSFNYDSTANHYLSRESRGARQSDLAFARILETP